LITSQNIGNTPLAGWAKNQLISLPTGRFEAAYYNIGAGVIITCYEGLNPRIGEKINGREVL
jgi:hypothetical protein